jgi:hypothetical protein
VDNLSVLGKASFAVNGFPLDKNDKASRILLALLTYIRVGDAAGCAEIFHKFLKRLGIHPMGENEID